MGGRVLFRMLKGFIYGNVVGLFAGIAIFLLAGAVESVAPIPIAPETIFALIYGASATAGVAFEYATWLDRVEAEENQK